MHVEAFTGEPLSLAVVAAQKAEKRVPGIDLLRGFCIVAAVLHHINLRIHFLRIHFRGSSLGQLIGPATNRPLFRNVYHGVRISFVISPAF
jgi:uncharacterized membrane protein